MVYLCQQEGRFSQSLEGYRYIRVMGPESSECFHDLSEVSRKGLKSEDEVLEAKEKERVFWSSWSMWE